MADSSAPLVENHREDGWFAVAIIMTIVETIFFSLRVYCRKISNVTWGADDYLSALGYVSCLALNAVGIAITKSTWVGQHTDEVAATDPESIVLFLKLQIPLAVTYLCAAVIPKMAIICLFLRVFIQRQFRIACWVVQTVLILFFLAGLASILSACIPFNANWKLPGTLSPTDKCIDLTSLYKAGSYPNVVTDVAIIILPIPVVWKVRKSTSEKLGLLATFCLGLIGLAFSIARLEAFFTVFNNFDVLWTAAYTGIFTTLEPASYFLVACMMTFRQLLRLPCCGGRLKSLFTSSPSGSGGTATYRPPNRYSARGPNRASITRVVSSGEANDSDTFQLTHYAATKVTTRDEERQVEDTGHRVVRGESADDVVDKHGTSDRLSRAHNRPRYPGVVVISTSPELRSDGRAESNASLHERRHGEREDDEEANLREVREARAIAVRREVDLRWD